MSAPGFTPISLYYSTTASAAPSAGNLANGELALNITDGKLYYKNNSGVVTLLASAAGASGDVVGPASATDNALVRFDTTTGKLVQNSVGLLSDLGVLTGLTGLTSSGSITFSSLTSGRVTYAGASGLLTDSANLTFNGTDLTVSGAVNAGTINATTLDLTNIEVTNIKAKDGTAAMQIADSTGVVSFTSNPVLSGGTANGVAYLNGSKVITTGSALTFDGATLVSGTGIRANSYMEIRSNTAALYWENAANTLYWSQTLASSDFAWSYYNGSSLAEQMRLTSTGLGIGTSSPATYSLAPNLVVATATSGGLTIRSGTTGYGGIFFADGTSGDEQYRGFIQYNHGFSSPNDALIFGTAGSGKAILDASGNLGLGVTPSAWGAAYKAFEFGGGGSALFSGTSGTAQTYLTANAYFNGTNWIYKNTAIASFYEQSGGAHRWHIAPSGTAGDAISFTQAMTLDASGNWMAGTTTAIGRATVVGGGTSQLAFHDGNGGSSNYGYLNYGGNSGELTLNANSSGGSTLIRFLTSNGGSNGERARIDSVGNFIVLPNSGNARIYAQDCYTVTGGASANMIVGSDGGFYRSTSSLKYKKNVQDATHGLSSLLQLRPVTYESKNENEAGVVYGGLIAEEVHEAGLTEFVQYADDHTPDALAYGNMVSLCIKAIQEQQAIITALTARVAALESSTLQ